MKAEDIQIGDYLEFPIGIEKVIDLPYIEGKGICASFAANATLIPVEVDELKPIPLIPKILEKNFEKMRGVENHYGLSDDYFAVVIREVTDSIWQVEYANCEAHFPVCRNLVCHVHQLQNVLRLLGIKKEIIL